MLSEKEKMLAGELYDAGNRQLVAERHKARQLLMQLNTSASHDTAGRQALLAELLGTAGENLSVEPPFYCDYGYNITTGRNVFINFNCVILDVAPVTLGDNVLLGPNVQLYTALHPLDWKQRAEGLEYAKPLVIGSHVWIGGGAILCPGITIGDRSIIGAGSVVTRDVPPDTVVAGNPAKVIRVLSSG
jgi:maltose O-acetyltransferase